MRYNSPILMHPCCGARNVFNCQVVTRVSMGGRLYQACELDGLNVLSIQAMTKTRIHLMCYVVLRDNTNMVYIQPTRS